jgi:hypothetical protein
MFIACKVAKPKPYVPGLVDSQLPKTSPLRVATKVMLITASPVGIQYHAFALDSKGWKGTRQPRASKLANVMFTGEAI